MKELLPCPFCGRIPKVEDCGSNNWFVKCDCGIVQDKLYHQRCDAVRNWNIRKYKGGSFNGRTRDFDSCNTGSTPVPLAKDEDVLVSR